MSLVVPGRKPSICFSSFLHPFIVSSSGCVNVGKSGSFFAGLSKRVISTAVFAAPRFALWRLRVLAVLTAMAKEFLLQLFDLSFELRWIK